MYLDPDLVNIFLKVRIGPDPDSHRSNGYLPLLCTVVGPATWICSLYVVHVIVHMTIGNEPSPETSGVDPKLFLRSWSDFWMILDTDPSRFLIAVPDPFPDFYYLPFKMIIKIF
jgi:hypothetical protein